MKQLLVYSLFLITLTAFKIKNLKEVSGVTPTENSKSAGSTSVAPTVAALAEAFKATLSAEQVASLQIPLTKANAIRWSNLPGGVSIRNGLEFSTLSPVQLAAAKAVIAAAVGTTANEGYYEFSQISAADVILGQSQGQRASGNGGPPGGGPPRVGRGGGMGYSSGKYIIAFLGTPGTTGTWMLQFGGHHYAQNITFSNGVPVSATPSHQGLEPLSWTTDNTTYAPLKQEAEAMAALLASMSTSELAIAKLSVRFGDVLLGPNKDGQFPATKSGIKVGTLNKAVKSKVLAAMMPWLNDFDDTMKAKLLTAYTNELDDTYVSYSGNTNGVSGDPGSFLTSNADYVRIDGPGVWIEFVCQNGVVMPGIHYHTVFRDHTRDYNGL